MIIAVNYHYIRTNFEQPHPGIFGITPLIFEQQLETLSKYGNFISQVDLRHRIMEGEPSDNNKIDFIITFDDGLKEQFDEALPILSRKGIPAVFYVNTSNFENRNFSLVHQIHLLRSQISTSDFLKLVAGDRNSALTAEEISKAVEHYRYDDNDTAVLKYFLNFKLTFSEQTEIMNRQFPNYFSNTKALHESFYMSKEQLMHIADFGYLGTHGHEHIPMGLYPEAEIQRQIKTSKTYLEDLTGKEIYGISYPYGSREAAGGKVPLIAEANGLLYGFSTERAGNTNLRKPLLMARFNCNDLPGGKGNLFNDLKPGVVEARQWTY